MLKELFECVKFLFKTSPTKQNQAIDKTFGFQRADNHTCKNFECLECDNRRRLFIALKGKYHKAEIEKVALASYYIATKHRLPDENISKHLKMFAMLLSSELINEHDYKYFLHFPEFLTPLREIYNTDLNLIYTLVKNKQYKSDKIIEAYIVYYKNHLS
jgi:hypothetical protein